MNKDSNNQSRFYSPVYFSVILHTSWYNMKPLTRSATCYIVSLLFKKSDGIGTEKGMKCDLSLNKKKKKENESISPMEDYVL